MNTNVLTVGDKAIIKRKSNIDNTEYTSQIQDIDGEKIRISTPMYKSALIRFRQKNRIELLVLGETKVFELDAEVVGITSEGNISYTDIVVTSPIKKIERRNYFRVRMVKDIYIREKNEEELVEFIPAISIDLSGGGVQFSTSHDFEENIIVEIKMDMDGKEVLMDGELLNKSWQDGLGVYKYSVEFKDLSNLIQEMLIGYLFKIQREKLNKR